MSSERLTQDAPPIRVLLLNGPNLNSLGRREPELYGTTTLAEIEADLRRQASERGVALTCCQSNHEGELIDLIQDAADTADGIVLNAGGFTHTSVALRDALLGAGVPTVEVHLSHLARREPFRRRSLIADVAVGAISGFGALGYSLAFQAIIHTIEARRAPCIRPMSSEKDCESNTKVGSGSSSRPPTSSPERGSPSSRPA